MKKLPIKRIPYYDSKLKNKIYMSEGEVFELFSGNIIIEEKIDGSSNFTKNGNEEYYFENIEFKHSVHYNHLPRYVRDCGLVILNKKVDGSFLDVTDLENSAPVIFRGVFDGDIKELLNELMNKKSLWSDDFVEGIVVKNYDKQMFGKISRFDNSGEIDEHWTNNKIRNYSQSD